MRVAVPVLLAVSLVLAAPAFADEYADTVDTFQRADASNLFDSAYGYAIFPTVGKGGVGVGGAYGKGRVYAEGQHVGDTRLFQASIGFQWGGQAYSQIIFFQDRRAFEEFTSGNFEFDANASAVAVTASASAGTGTTGTSASISGGRKDATTVAPGYYRGMAVFTVAKGGLMYEAAVGGQKFQYTPTGG